MTTKITTTMTVAEATVRAIFENPGLNNKQVLRVVQTSHPGRGTEKTVAWYRAHARKVPGDLARNLLAVIAEHGGPSKVPSAMAGGGVRPAAPSLDHMAEQLRAAGYHVARALIEAPATAAPVEPEPEAPKQGNLRKASK